jgi:hypothetical protein
MLLAIARRRRFVAIALGLGGGYGDAGKKHEARLGE